MSLQKGDDEFNVIQFEKRLTALKDSQDNINACCKWCLENRQHHKKIVLSWLNVLKRVKIEQRVNLFYLANDVIQYSKRRNYEFVESWGTALQKATTLVRDDKVKHKIVRIFNIWEQRGVYNEEFISDLCGLISVVPTAPKNDEPHEFQPSYVINKIKHCSKLENETDSKLKVLKEHNPKIQLESETFCSSLKDRAHVDDVEKELEVYVKHLEGYINALKAEIKCRITNISVLKQANIHLDKDKRDVKVIANAYKTFGQRVKTFQKKLEEHRITLTSPIPSPDINAPSPSPDSDIELPDEEKSSLIPPLPITTTQQYNANYYNPVPPPATTNFVTNGYTSFIGSSFNPSTLFTNATDGVTNSSYSLNTSLTSVLPPPPPIEVPVTYQTGHLPLLPPPMPPFNPNEPSYNSYNEKSAYDPSSYQTSDNNYYEPSQTSGIFDNALNSSVYTTVGNNDEYNPEQEPDNWEADGNWNQPPPLDADTPESPPIFEKEGGFSEPVEYHDTVSNSGGADVDHRVLHPVAPKLDNLRGRGKDVDHRNLISLTGSPAETTVNIPTTEIWNQSTDQDYRNSGHPLGDQDYRLPFNIEQLKLPPPPPPPPKSASHKNSPRKLQDNVESIDMELSEDENDDIGCNSLKPPPPLPDLPDDVDANCFLDDLNSDLNAQEFEGFTNSQFSIPPPPVMQWNNGGGQFRGIGGNGRGQRGNFSNSNNNNNNNNSNRGTSVQRARGGRGGTYRGNFRSRGFRRPMRNFRQRGNFRGGNFQSGY